MEMRMDRAREVLAEIEAAGYAVVDRVKLAQLAELDCNHKSKDDVWTDVGAELRALLSASRKG